MPKPYYVIIEREARNGIKEYSVAREVRIPGSKVKYGIWPFRGSYVIPEEVYQSDLFIPCGAEEAVKELEGQLVKKATFGNRQAAEEFIDEQILKDAERAKFEIIKEVTTRYPHV